MRVNFLSIFKPAVQEWIVYFTLALSRTVLILGSLFAACIAGSQCSLVWHQCAVDGPAAYLLCVASVLMLMSVIAAWAVGAYLGDLWSMAHCDWTPGLKGLALVWVVVPWHSVCVVLAVSAVALPYPLLAVVIALPSGFLMGLFLMLSFSLLPENWRSSDSVC